MNGRFGFLLAIMASIALVCSSLIFSTQGSSGNAIKLTSASLASNSAFLDKSVSSEASGRSFGYEPMQDVRHGQRFLRARPTSTKASNLLTPRDVQQGRKLPGEYPGLVDPAKAVTILFIILLLFLFCCCRGMLCDLLACFCLYNICCDDGAVGGFDLMTL